MDKLYYFFDMEFEKVDHKLNLPFRILVESIGYVGPHWHPDLELILCLSGKVGIGSGRAQRFLSAGDLFLVNSEEVHSLAEEEENLVLVLQIDSSLFPSSGCFFITETNKQTQILCDSIRKDMAKLVLEKWDNQEAWETMGLSCLYHLSAQIIRHFGSDSPERTQPKGFKQKNRAKEIMDYLQCHYREKIKLNDAACKLGISPFYLSHQIKESTGYSFLENLNFIRTGKAVDLMMKSEMNLLEISLTSGFSDPKYFNQYFKRLFGMTPREMKRQPDWKNAILKHMSNDGLKAGTGRTLIESYL